MNFTLFFAIPLISLGIVAGAQESSGSMHGSSNFHGKVVDAGTQEPVRLAAIKIFTSGDRRYELTDGEGRFQFAGLAPVNYSLLAHRDGYTDRSYAVTQSDVAAGTEFPVELERQGLIAGRVLDGMGRPLQSARVEALSVRGSGGKAEVVASAESSDQGRYRLSGLDPGIYQIRATYHEGREDEFDTTPAAIASSYFGGSEGAAEMAVKKGTVTEGIDFALNPVPPVAIRGELQTESGAFTGRATLWIMGQKDEGGHNANVTNGAFEIADVAPGTYTISAQTLKADPSLFGMSVVEVRNADVAGVKLVLRPVPMLEGEILFNGSAATDLSRSAIYFNRSDGIVGMGMNIAHPAADNKFTIVLIPGEYRLAFDGPVAKLGIENVTFDGKPVVNWKIRIDDSASAHKFVIAIEGKKP